MSRSLIVVDTKVTDYQTLLAGFAAEGDVLRLAQSGDGIGQMAAYLAGKTGYSAIHLVSHGGPGALYLGGSVVDQSNVADYADALAEIGQALTEGGDLLLYGCGVAAGDTGQRFLASLAELSGLDVAASTNSTGAASLGADWLLESQIGEVASPLLTAATAGWTGLLAAEHEPNDSRSQANLLTSGVAVTGTLFYSGMDIVGVDETMDYYKIVLTAPAAVNLTLNRPDSVSAGHYGLTLTDSSGGLIFAGVDSADPQTFDPIGRLQAGTYFVTVGSAAHVAAMETNSYSLTVTADYASTLTSVPEVEPNDSRPQANVLNSGTTVTGTLFDDPAVMNIVGADPTADYYAITLTAAGAIDLQLDRPAGLAAGHYALKLTDSNGGLIFAGVDSADPQVFAPIGRLEPGTYYVTVGSNAYDEAMATNRYSLTVTADYASPLTSVPEVEANDSRNQANPLAAGTAVTGTLYDDPDVMNVVGADATADYYRLTLAAPGVVSLSLDRPSNVAAGRYRVSLIDSGDSVIFTGQDAADPQSFADSAVLPAGNYFVVVGSASYEAAMATSRYSLLANVNYVPVGNNDLGVAGEAGGTANGSLGSNATGNVLANDTDANVGTILTVTGVRLGATEGGGTAGAVGQWLTGSYGNLKLNANGSYSYVVGNGKPVVNALPAGATLSESFNYTLSDGALSDTALLTLTITGANDAPVASNDLGAAIEAGGVTNAIVGRNATGNVLSNDTDVDTGASRSVIGVRRGGTEGSGAAGVLGSALTGSYGSLTMNVDGSYVYVVRNGVAAVNALAAGATLKEFFNYTVSDGTLTDIATLTVTITGANDAPVLPELLAVSYVDSVSDDIFIESSGLLAANDPDTPALSHGIEGGVDHGETVAKVGGFGSLMVDKATGAYTFFPDEAVIEALKGEAQEMYTLTVTDGQATASTRLTVNVAGANDSPVVTAGGHASYVEYGAPAVIDGGLVIADVDDVYLTGATVAIGSGLSDGDRLGFVDQLGISGSYDGGTGMLTLTGVATLADYQTALRSVTYASTSHSPAASSASRTIQWRVTDSGIDGVGVQASLITTSTIDVQGRPSQVTDFDGDRKSDLPWYHTATGGTVLWNGADSTLAQSVASSADLARKVAGIGDFDGDGRSDVLWRHVVTGANEIWLGGDPAAVQLTSRLADRNWKVAGIGDFDADGKSDILWRHAAGGNNAIWKGGDSSATLAIKTVADQNWLVAGIGDFDGDSRSDILWRNQSTGGNNLWLGGDSARPRAVSAMTDRNWKVAGIGDFDGDGKSDILWRHAGTGANKVWRSGNSTSVQIVATIGPVWQVAGTGDYNGDGRSDILWRNTSTGANKIWQGAASLAIHAVATQGLDYAAVDGLNSGDLLIGGGGANNLCGTLGDDSLSGGTGNDTLSGGGGGTDIMVGGAGNDTFVIDRVAALTAAITDFVAGEDKLGLAQSTFGALFSEGSLKAWVFASSNSDACTTTGQRLQYNAATGALWYDSDGTGAAPAVQIATLGSYTGRPSLVASDFLAVTA